MGNSYRVVPTTARDWPAAWAGWPVSGMVSTEWTERRADILSVRPVMQQTAGALFSPEKLVSDDRWITHLMVADSQSLFHSRAVFQSFDNAIHDIFDGFICHGRQKI